MMWKAIGCSVAGTSHELTGKPCEDALEFKAVRGDYSDEVLICCVADGAGSARYGAFAAALCTSFTVDALTELSQSGVEIAECDIYNIAERIYDKLEEDSRIQEAELNEYSCTFLGCYLSPTQSVFFQIGDGAIIRDDGSGFYIPVWWPDNGEYQNTTCFLVDDPAFSRLNISILQERTNEVAIFTDGLQLLALNIEKQQVHQPFFTDLFKYLRMADSDDKVAVLNRKLTEYLNSAAINNRTDDDKTLFLATTLLPG